MQLSAAELNLPRATDSHLYAWQPRLFPNRRFGTSILRTGQSDTKRALNGQNLKVFNFLCKFFPIF
jgi:hypothetical protein